MPLLLSFAAAIGFSLAAVFTPSPEQPPAREAFTWDGMQELTEELSAAAQFEDSDTAFAN